MWIFLRYAAVLNLKFMLVISDSFFFEIKETGEWKRTLVLSDVKVKNSWNLVSTPQYDSMFWCLKLQGGNFIYLSKKFQMNFIISGDLPSSGQLCSM
jgi:hypothetical protein